MVGMQLVLLLGLMPLTVLIFQRCRCSAPVANLLSVPVFSIFTVPLTLASMVARPVSAACSPICCFNCGGDESPGLSGLSPSSRHSRWPILVAGVNGPDSSVMCVVFLPAIWVLLPRGWPGRWLAVLAVIALLLYKPAPRRKAASMPQVLDVGQGLAVVVQSRDSTLVFDTGRSYRDGGSAAEQLVLPFLRYRGIASIDRLVVSHC